MAIDETLMEFQGDPWAVPSLRFYTWSSPSLTVGYFQNVEEAARRFRCRELKTEVARRLTGGGAVFHGSDLTFSLTMKIPNALIAGDVKNSYLKINEALMAGLKVIYPGLDFADCRTVPSSRGAKSAQRICFETPSCYDLLLDGKKVVGASQRRRDGSLLHQSAVFLRGEPLELQKLIVDGFRKKWSVEFVEKNLTPDEFKKAEILEGQRYRSPEWALNVRH